jgi:fructokinase
MGMSSYIISALGDDDLGHQAMEAIKLFNMNNSYISVLKGYPTGTVDVELSGDGIPTYIIHEDTAWDNIVLSKEQLKKLSSENWDVFCFGTLAQRTEANRKLLFEILASISAKHIFYDVNLRQEYYRKK